MSAMNTTPPSVDYNILNPSSVEDNTQLISIQILRQFITDTVAETPTNTSPTVHTKTRLIKYYKTCLYRCRTHSDTLTPKY